MIFCRHLVCKTFLGKEQDDQGKATTRHDGTIKRQDKTIAEKNELEEYFDEFSKKLEELKFMCLP